MGRFLTANGFVRKSFTEILVDIQGKFKSAFGQEFDLTPDSPNGVLINSMALMVDDAYAVAEEVYDSLSPTGANGSSLDTVMAYSGMTRKAATKMAGLVAMFTTGSSLSVPASTVALRGRDSLRLVSKAALSVSSSSAEVVYLSCPSATTGSVQSYTFAFSFGTFTLSNNNPILALRHLSYLVAPYAGTLMTTEGLFIIPNTGSMSVTTVPNVYTVEYGGQVLFEAEDAGYETAAVGEVNSLYSSVSGVSSVYNLSAMTAGSDVESDDAGRLRIVAFNKHGKDVATDRAIESHLLNSITGVTMAKVTSNRGMSATASGQPPKSIAAVVVGGTDAEVAQGLYESVSGGIETYGSTEVAITDVNGDEQVFRFSRPVVKYLWMEIALYRNPEESFPSSVESSVKTSVDRFSSDELNIGTDVHAERFKQAIYSVDHAIASAEVMVAVTDDLLNPPSQSDYTTGTISVASNAVVVCDTTRIGVRFA